MLGFFRKIKCQCTNCGLLVRVPQRRIHAFEQLFELKPGTPFVWECHRCHDGAIIPGPYTNIHGQKVTISAEDLAKGIEVHHLP